MSPAASISALRERIRQIEQPARHGVLPFGVAAIDRALPGGGLALGAVHEIIGAGGDEEDGAAAAGFAAGILARLGGGTRPTSPSPPLARQVPSLSPLKGGEGKKAQRFSLSARHGPLGDGEGRGEVGDPRAAGSGPVLWCLRRPDLYGPGLMAHGLDPARLVLVTAARDDEILWAVEEGLCAGSTAGLAAVVGELGRLPMVAGRRLQLAAERSGVTALILRRWRNADEAAAGREQPSAALTRWRVAALSSVDIINEPGANSSGARESGLGQPRWRVALLRCRGGMPGAWDVEVADATGHVSLSAELADRPAAPPEQRATGEQRPLWVSAESLRRAG
jgi:protein ImuA